MKTIDYAEGFGRLCKALEGAGAFLLVQDPSGLPNPMTIGWATLGVVWGDPTLTVLVRPSRHSFGLIESGRRFSVCIPSPGELEEQLGFCGAHSGRSGDKLSACGLKAVAGRASGISVLEGCSVFYECETVHKSLVTRENLEPGILGSYYPDGDFHTVYFGKILHAYEK